LDVANAADLARPAKQPSMPTIDLDPATAEALMAAAASSSETSENEKEGEYGLLLPEGTRVAAALIGDEMLSRATTAGPAACEFVMHHMRNDPRPEVQSKGCGAVSQIAETPPGREALFELNAVEVLVAAMTSATPKEVDLQAKACSALANLAIGEGEAVVMKKGGLSAVLSAGRAHLTEPSVQFKVCAALGNLAYSSAGEQRTLAEGGLEAVVAAMKAHPSNAGVQAEGVDALVNIADSAAGKKQLLALGGLGVVAAAKKHPMCAAAAGELAVALVTAAKA
jgi:hypothetical protein